ncbi:MAG: hypothetical protein JOZ55_11010 [Alphaproteobacteria bacterium]|nr:hypothetical protein [Alphaproteobacteria bacterium]
MLRRLLHRYTRAFERRYAYDGSYMHEMLDASTPGFLRYAIMQSAGGSWRAGAPVNAWCAAGIAGALVEDCGPCVQIASDMAVEAGMAPATVAALLSGTPTDADAQLGFDYGRALLNASDNLDELRERIEARWGRKALLAISLRAMTGRNFPVLKRALGHAKSCQRVRVGNAEIAVAQDLKAA